MIGFAIGIILHLEEKKEFKKIIKIKSILTSTLGAIGDKLIYQMVLPVFILTTMNLIIYSYFNPNIYVIFLVLILSFLFVFSHFLVRFFSIKLGFYKGITSINFFKTRKFIKLNKIFNYIKSVLLIILMINLIVVFFV